MAAEPLVLAVDDERGILRLIQIELSEQGFRVIIASNAEEATKLAEQYRPDIALFDILMPGTDGIELMRQFRERWNTPVILVTARDRDSDKVRGLHLGADDYVVKPFNPAELGARIHAVLRRGLGTAIEKTVRAGEVEVDLNKRTVTRSGEPVAITRTEWLLLSHLATNASKVILTRELLVKVWGPEYLDDLQYLRVWVSRLRQKLEADSRNPKIIKTHPGIGYSFQPDADPVD